jgi:hypothetical protein
MTRETCRTGVGCSVINVEVGDVDSFYRVGVDGQLSRVTLSELKAAA